MALRYTSRPDSTTRQGGLLRRPSSTFQAISAQIGPPSAQRAGQDDAAPAAADLCVPGVPPPVTSTRAPSGTARSPASDLSSFHSESQAGCMLVQLLKSQWHSAADFFDVVLLCLSHFKVQYVICSSRSIRYDMKLDRAT